MEIPKFARIRTLPLFPVKVESRPGKPAFEFIRKEKIEIWLPNHISNNYYLIIFKKYYRVNFKGTPSALVQNEDFLLWFEEIKAEHAKEAARLKKIAEGKKPTDPKVKVKIKSN